MFQWVRLFCRLGVPPRAPRRDLLQQLLSNILRLGSCYSLNACASSSSPPASSLSVRPLRHSDSLPPKKKNTQTHSHSDPTTLRLSHNQTYSQPVQSHSDSHTGSPTLRLTLSGHSHTEIPSQSAYSYSDSCTLGIPRGSRQGGFTFTARIFTLRFTRHQAPSYSG